MQGDRSAGTGRPLRDVYSVSLGVALVLAVEQVIDLEREGLPIRGSAVLPFLAFTVTGFSVYHWATRFIDLFFSGSTSRPRAVAAVVALLAVGSTELLLLIALSILIAQPDVFLAALTIFLVFEVLAGLVLTRAGAYADVGGFGRAYLVVNVIALGLAVVGVAVSGVLDREVVTGLLAFAVGAIRAGGFYKAGFEVLFPTATTSPRS